MSSYYFTDTDAGPPGVGVNNGANCGNGRDWVSLYSTVVASYYKQCLFHTIINIF